MLLEGQVGTTLEKVRVFEDVVCAGERGVHIAELQGRGPVGVAEFSRMDRLAGFCQTLLDG